MILGVPKEIKNSEYRVGLTPAGAAELVRQGHEVYVQSGAGLGSGFDDEDYKTCGAKISKDARETYATAELIVKVKEPLESEYALIKAGQIVFTYFHFASSLALTQAMQASQSICIAYETVEKADRTLPLLTPMSEVAGRMAVQQGAKFLEKRNGGRGVLMGGITGVAPAHVLILGAGIVGTNAALMAAGLGARVSLVDVNLSRLRSLKEWMPANVTTLFSSQFTIEQLLPTTDLVIGAVLIPGAKAPVLISKEMLRLLRPGSVLIDVAVDQGGCIETCRPTTHEDPVYIQEGIVHYGVPNMPGAVPYTSTQGLTNATLPYILQLAGKGWKKACTDNEELRKGLNIVEGQIVYAPLAQSFHLPFTSFTS